MNTGSFYNLSRTIVMLQLDSSHSTEDNISDCDDNKMVYRIKVRCAWTKFRELSPIL